MGSSRNAHRDAYLQHDRDDCPRPDKIAYPTRVQARRALRRIEGRAGTLGVYRCRCGNYHLGNRPSHHDPTPGSGRKSSDSRPGFQPTETDATHQHRERSRSR